MQTKGALAKIMFVGGMVFGPLLCLGSQTQFVLVESLLETGGVEQGELAPFLQLGAMFPGCGQLVQSGCQFQDEYSVAVTGGFDGFSRNQQVWQ